MPIVGKRGPWLTNDGTGQRPIVYGPFCNMCGMLREDMRDDSFLPARVRWATVLLEPLYRTAYGVNTAGEAWNLVVEASANTHVCTPCGNMWWHTSPTNPNWPLHSWRHSVHHFNMNWPTQPAGMFEGGLFYCATVETMNTTNSGVLLSSLAVQAHSGCQASSIPSSPSTDSDVSGWDSGKYTSPIDTSDESENESESHWDRPVHELPSPMSDDVPFLYTV